MSDTTLKYNVRWIERTFTSPSVTQSLLSPERESGVITSNDFEAAVSFFPGPTRISSTIGTIACAAISYALFRPSWSFRRTALLMTGGCAAGFFIDNFMTLSAHLRFVHSIEDPSGFSRALDHVQKSVGGFSPPGPVIVRHGGKLAEESISFDTAASQEIPTNAAAIAAPPSSSKWEQIRAANSHISRNSSWDAIRQGHERRRVVDPGSNDDQTRHEDRATEQAKFDALLEKERNIK